MSTFDRNQWAYDQALNGIRNQAYEQSVDQWGDCVYRGPDNLKCAIGHCIGDQDYEPHFERKNIEFLVEANLPSLRGVQSKLITRLQRAHDQDLADGGRAAANAWEVTMRKIARDYDLTYTPPEGAQA